MSNTETKPATQELWASILENARSATGSHIVKPATILVVGPEGSGKSSLVARLKGEKLVDDVQGAGLEYTYLDVKEEDSEDVATRIGVYVLESTTTSSRLLQHVVTKDSLTSTIVILTADMSRPWALLDTLNNSVRLLEDYLQNMSRFPELEENKRRISFLSQSYGEKFANASEEEAALMNVKMGVPEVNIGLPIIVVPTKCDMSTYLEKHHDFRSEQFDFIQLSLRKFAYHHGAALIYSGKDGKNIEALNRYILHLAYKRTFTFTPTVAERDYVLIPIGWDNSTKLNLLADGMKFDADTRYEDAIPTPASRATATPMEITVDDEQEFLKKQLALLGKTTKTSGSESQQPASLGAPPSSTSPAAVASAQTQDKPQTSAAANLLSSLGGSRPSATPARGQPPPSPRAELRSEGVSAGTTSAPSKPRTSVSAGPSGLPAALAAKDMKPGAPGAAGGQNTDVLANFFNSLLTKKPPGAKPTTADAKTDAAAPKADGEADKTKHSAI